MRSIISRRGFSSSVLNRARLLDSTTSITRGSSGEVPQTVAPLIPKVRISKPTLPPAAKPITAVKSKDGSDRKQTRDGRLAGEGDRLQSQPIPFNLSDAGQGLQGLEEWLVKETNGLGRRSASIKSILVESSRVDGLIVLDTELANETAPEEGRRIPVALPTGAQIELNGQQKLPPPTINSSGRNGVVTLAMVIGGSKGNAVVELSSGFVIGEERDGLVQVIVCAHTIQSIALKLPLEDSVPTRAFIVSSKPSTSSDAPVEEVQIFPVDSVASAVLASDIVLLNVSTTPSASSTNGKLEPVVFSSLPVTSYPLPTGSTIALPSYKNLPATASPRPPSYQDLARRSAQLPKAKPRSLDPLDDIFFKLPNDQSPPKALTPTITNPNPQNNQSSTYFNDNFRPNTSSKSRVDIEAERKKILAVIKEMTEKDRAAVDQLSSVTVAGPIAKVGIELETREFQYGRVVEYKDDHSRVITIGSSDNLHAMTYTQIPTPGMSGSPIICAEQGNVVGIVRGSSNRYGDKQRRGFGTPAEAIFSMFKLPGMENDGKKITIQKNREQQTTKKTGIQANENGNGKDEK